MQFLQRKLKWADLAMIRKLQLHALIVSWKMFQILKQNSYKVLLQIMPLKSRFSAFVVIDISKNQLEASKMEPSFFQVVIYDWTNTLEQNGFRLIKSFNARSGFEMCTHTYVLGFLMK